MTQSATLEATVRLIKPTAKMSIRLLRQAIEQVTKAKGSDYLSLELNYSNTRSAIAHLMAHDRYQVSWVKDRVLELVQMTRELLSKPGVEKLSKKKDWVEQLGSTTDKLERFALKNMAEDSISRHDIETFLCVVEADQDLHKKEGLDPSDIIPVPHFVLAQMIVTNFKAYDKTLNT